MNPRPSLPRHPKEFVYTPIELSPLVKAAISGNWDAVKQLLSDGYSLLWLDPETNKSAMHLIARKAPKAMVEKIIAYSEIENGIDSAAHQFVVLEASDDPIKELVLLHDKINRTNSSTNPEDNSFPLIPASVFYLYRDNHDDHANSILQRAYMNRDSVDLDSFISAIMQAGASRDGQVSLMYLFEVIKAVLYEQRDDAVTKCAIAEAAAYGYENWALAHLSELEGSDNIDEYLGEAIVSAARRGKSSLIFKLCERARQLKVDKTKRFMDLLACASGAALVNEHYVLAKMIMLMVPHFQAKPSDLKELQKWPASKIARMFRDIRNYKIFTDIAMHSGLANTVNSAAWSLALKMEYGLEAMSDAGFCYLIHHPETITILCKYRPNMNASPTSPSFDRGVIQAILTITEDRLPIADIQHFLHALSRNRANKDKNHFNRIRYFTDATVQDRLTPAEEHVCLKIKEDIAKLLIDSMGNQDTKKFAIDLHTSLLDAVSLQYIKKLLDKALVPDHAQPMSAKSISLLSQCLKIFNKHQSDLAKSQVGTSIGN